MNIKWSTKTPLGQGARAYKSDNLQNNTLVHWADGTNDSLTKNFERFYKKNVILGTSDAWLTSRLSHRPSEPAYYVVDCRILNYVRLANITMAIYKVPIKHYWCNSRKAVLKEFVKLGLSILAQSSS